MTSEVQPYRRLAPTSLREWAAVARSAVTKVVRTTSLVGAVILLAAISGNTSIYYQFGGLALALACLSVVFGPRGQPWVFYIVGYVLFVQLRAHADEIGTPVQFTYPIDGERILFAGNIPTILLQDAFYSYARLGVLEAYTIGVYLSFFFIPHIFALALWRWDRPRFNVYAPAFLITLYIGLAVCAVAPTAPPWMAAEAGVIPRVYQIVPDITQHVAPGAYQAGENTAGTNAVASMPSLHAAIPYLMAIALWKHRRLRWAGVWYAASMSFAIVYLGEHYFVDALAGLATASFAWLAARRALAWWDVRKAGDAPTRVSERSAAEGVTG